MADGYFNGSSDFWLGGFNSFVDETWAWSDYGNFSYTNWESGQPSNSNTTSCISSQFSSSNWYANDCLQRKPFICELFISEPCPKDWLYWPYTNKCYSYQSGLPFYDASAFCQNLSATLTSVHNSAENFFIAAQGLASFNYSYNFGASWLGFHDPNQNGQWQWTDGTNANFTYWGSSYPDGKAFCAALINGNSYDAQGLENRWATFPCIDGLAFWCSMDSLI